MHSARTDRRAAFTLIELLVVIAIILILLSLMIVGAGVIKRTLVRTKSNTICMMVHTAIETASAQRGLRPAPSEHPLAGSAATDILSGGGVGALKRAMFARAGGGAPVLTTGEALKISEISWVDGADQDRVLLPDDTYLGHIAEGDLPLLFGLPRQRIGILGASCDWITTWRNLPSIDSPYRDPARRTTLVKPYDRTKYADGDFLFRPQLGRDETLEVANRRQLEIMLGPQLNELSELGAIRHANDADVDADPAQLGKWITATVGTGATAYVRKVDAMDVLDPPKPTDPTDAKDPPKPGGYDTTHRVLLVSGQTEPGKWIAGNYPYYREGSKWRAYALRGHSVVDAYGTELVFWQDDRAKTYIVSAGEDRVFAVDPGKDGRIDTPGSSFRYGDASTIHEKDKDGSPDNVGGIP